MIRWLQVRGRGEVVIRPKRRDFDQSGLIRSQTISPGALDHGTGPTIASMAQRCRVQIDYNGLSTMAANLARPATSPFALAISIRTHACPGILLWRSRHDSPSSRSFREKCPYDCRVWV
jgi:hypothetical protein